MLSVPNRLHAAAAVLLGLALLCYLSKQSDAALALGAIGFCFELTAWITWLLIEFARKPEVAARQAESPHDEMFESAVLPRLGGNGVTLLERLAMGLVTGILGFLTGLFAWWMLSDTVRWSFYLQLSCILGIVFFFLGAWRADKATDILGTILEKLWVLWSEVLRVFERLR